jgi:hypothetical protein
MRFEMSEYHEHGGLREERGIEAKMRGYEGGMRDRGSET